MKDQTDNLSRNMDILEKNKKEVLGIKTKQNL